MFNHLTNLGYIRNRLQAFGFYIAYLILILVVGALIGGIIGFMFNAGYTTEQRFTSGVHVGTAIAILSALGLSFTILIKKQRYEFIYILLAVFSGMLALLGGGLLGLIPAAYLTTLTNASAQDNADTTDPAIRDIETTPGNSTLEN